MATNTQPDPTALASAEAARAAGLTVFQFTTDGRRPEIEKSLQPAELTELLDDIRLKALPDKGDGKKRCRLIASTNVRDLAGDTFTQKALGEMESQAPGTVMFLNHRRSVPEDVFGTVETAKLVERTVRDAHGSAVKVAALEYVVIVDEANERAGITFKQIENGVRLGASVTVAVLDKQPNSKGVGDVINGVYYLECSIVGIPMNPASFVEYAQKSLDAARVTPPAAAASDAAEAATAPAATQDQSSPQTAAATPAPVAQKSVTGEATADAITSALSEIVEPGTDPATIYQKGQAVSMAVAYLVSKGLFTDELAKRKPTAYELYDCYTTIMYRLWRLRNANQSAGVEDVFDYRAALTEIAQEFAAALLDTSVSYFGLDGEQPAAMGVSSYSLEMVRGLEVLAKGYAEGTREASEDAALWRQVHDAAVACGAPCSAKSVSETDAAGGAQPASEVVSKSQYDAANLERETWKATAQAALALAEKQLNEPLPRAGQ